MVLDGLYLSKAQQNFNKTVIILSEMPRRKKSVNFRAPYHLRGGDTDRGRGTDQGEGNGPSTMQTPKFGFYYLTGCGFTGYWPVERLKDSSLLAHSENFM